MYYILKKLINITRIVWYWLSFAATYGCSEGHSLPVPLGSLNGNTVVNVFTSNHLSRLTIEDLIAVKSRSQIVRDNNNNNRRLRGNYDRYRILIFKGVKFPVKLLKQAQRVHYW